MQVDTRAPPFSLLEFGDLVSAALASPDPLPLLPLPTSPSLFSLPLPARESESTTASITPSRRSVRVRTLFTKLKKRASSAFAFVAHHSASSSLSLSASASAAPITRREAATLPARAKSPEYWYRLPELRLSVTASNLLSLASASNLLASTASSSSKAAHDAQLGDVGTEADAEADPFAPALPLVLQYERAYGRSAPSLPYRARARSPVYAHRHRQVASEGEALVSPSSSSSSAASSPSTSSSQCASSSDSSCPTTPLTGTLSTVSESRWSACSSSSPGTSPAPSPDVFVAHQPPLSLRRARTLALPPAKPVPSCPLPPLPPLPSPMFSSYGHPYARPKTPTPPSRARSLRSVKSTRTRKSLLDAFPAVPVFTPTSDSPLSRAGSMRVGVSSRPASPSPLPSLLRAASMRTVSRPVFTPAEMELEREAQGVEPRTPPRRRPSSPFPFRSPGSVDWLDLESPRSSPLGPYSRSRTPFPFLGGSGSGASWEEESGSSEYSEEDSDSESGYSEEEEEYGSEDGEDADGEEDGDGEVFHSACSSA